MVWRCCLAARQKPDRPRISDLVIPQLVDHIGSHLRPLAHEHHGQVPTAPRFRSSRWRLQTPKISEKANFVFCRSARRRTAFARRDTTISLSVELRVCWKLPCFPPANRRAWTLAVHCSAFIEWGGISFVRGTVSKTTSPRFRAFRSWSKAKARSLVVERDVGRNERSFCRSEAQAARRPRAAASVRCTRRCWYLLDFLRRPAVPGVLFV